MTSPKLKAKKPVKAIPKLELNLQDTAVAFADKTNAELKKRYWLFKLMNSSFFTNLGTTTAELGLRFHLPINWAIKATVFKHFLRRRND